MGTVKYSMNQFLEPKVNKIKNHSLEKHYSRIDYESSDCDE